MNSNSKYHLKNGDKIEISRDIFPIESFLPPQKYDPEWVWIDGWGHRHEVIDKFSVSDTTKKTELSFCQDCEEVHEDYITICSRDWCYQEMPMPPMVPDLDAPTVIYGLMTIKLTTKQYFGYGNYMEIEKYLTEEEYNQYIQEHMEK